MTYIKKSIIFLPMCYSVMVLARAIALSIYMPMILEAAYAMLACARIGAVHSVVFGGFAAPP